MKKMLLLIAMLVMLSCPVHANIIIETDNFNDTISYRTYRNVNSTGINEYSFIKNIDRDENEVYFLRLIINFINYPSSSSRYLLDSTADVTVDGQVFKVPKAVNTSLPRTFQRVNLYDLCYYSIPQESVDAIAKAKTVSFTINVPTKDPYVISISKDGLLEIQNIILNRHFSNYLEDINPPKKEVPKKTEEQSPASQGM